MSIQGSANRPIATYAAIVTPSDTVSLDAASVLFIGGAGNVNVKTEGGQTVLFSGLSAGDILPVSVTQVLNTNTTATLIVALW